MIDEDELKEKQEYLRINIIEKGYNPDDFTNYIQTLKGDEGLEIENWSKNELINAVLEFKKIYPKKQDNEIVENEENKEEKKKENEEKREKEEKKEKKDEKKENEKKIEKEKNEENKKNEDNHEKIDDKNIQNFYNQLKMKELIPCKKSEENGLSNKGNIIIKVSDPVIIEGGFFSKKYITYSIETSPLGFKVRRKYDDCIWLYNTMKSLYNNCIIPPLNIRSFIITEEKYLKRMRILEKFLQEISIHPILKDSQIFYDFISIKIEKDFSLKKSKYNKLTPPKKVEEFNGVNGEINININKAKEFCADRIKLISENNETIMKKIIKEYKSLNVSIQEVVSKMKNISSIWDELYVKNINYSEKEVILSIYYYLAKLMGDWAKMQEEQINLINLKLKEYFRYIKNEYHSIKQYKNYEESQNNFKKSSVKLKEKKEKLFEEKNINEWGLDKEDSQNPMLLLKSKELSIAKMLPEETKKVKEKEKLYGCYLNSFIDEYKTIVDLNIKRHKENILSFIKDISNNIINFHVSLNEMIGHFDTLKEK